MKRSRNKLVNGTSSKSYCSALYIYNPPLENCRSRETLMKILKTKHEDGPIGTLEDHILASVPHGERVLKVSKDYYFVRISDEIIIETKNMP